MWVVLRLVVWLCVGGGWFCDGCEMSCCVMFVLLIKEVGVVWFSCCVVDLMCDVVVLLLGGWVEWLFWLVVWGVVVVWLDVVGVIVVCWLLG